MTTTKRTATADEVERARIEVEEREAAEVENARRDAAERDAAEVKRATRDQKERDAAEAKGRGHAKVPKAPTKPRAKKVKPHPLAGITPELDALVAAAPGDEERGDLSDGERALLIRAAEVFIAGIRSGASDGERRKGIDALFGLNAYAFRDLGMV